MKNSFKKGYLESARKKFLFLGFIITCSITLVAFKVSSYDFEEAEKSKIVVPEDETTIFFELPEATPKKQKAASKAVLINVERYTIEKEVTVEYFDDKKIDMDNLTLDNIGGEDPWNMDGDEEEKEIIPDPNITVNWSRRVRTPFYDDCEDEMDREAESLCSYSKIRRLVQENTVFPSIPRELGLSASVLVTFVIDKEGNVKDVQVHNSKAHKDFIKAAIKGVETLPQMNPGTQNLRPVNIKLSIPVSFNLQ